MMFQTIAFDADDTLWDNEILYIQAKARFIEILSAYTSDAEWIERRLDEIEEGNVPIYGYGIKSFTLSLLEAAMEISQGAIRSGDLQAVLALGRGMLTAPVSLFPHAEEVLSALRRKGDLMLITKGDVFEQSKKIDRSGLLDYFRYVEIVGEKTIDVYRALLERHRIEPSRFLMIGNALRSDILPVLALGGKAVYIPYANTWAHEHKVEADFSRDGYYEVEHLGQLPDLLRKLGWLDKE